MAIAATDILKQFESELWRSSRQTKNVMLYHAKKYFEFAAGADPFDRQTVLSYLRHLEQEEKYASNTVRMAGHVIHRLFEVAQVRFPLGKRWLPEATDVDKPALTESEIKQMVKAKLAPDESAFLALSTTYGLRREELRRIQNGDVDYTNATIFIRTCKHGDQRVHLLAKQIIPVVKKHDFSKTYTPNMLSQIWHSIEQKSGLQHKYSSGWHSIRRYLDTVLLEKAGLENTAIFLRWQISRSSFMPLHYISKDTGQVDEEIFEIHPVLPLWAERKKVN